MQNIFEAMTANLSIMFMASKIGLGFAFGACLGVFALKALEDLVQYVSAIFRKAR